MTKHPYVRVSINVTDTDEAGAEYEVREALSRRGIPEELIGSIKFYELRQNGDRIDYEVWATIKEPA